MWPIRAHHIEQYGFFQSTPDTDLCKELRIAEFIDNQIPNQSEHRHISYGQLLVSIILNGLGFVSRTLHMYPAHFADKPIERHLGARIKPQHIDDDVLRRCLDKLFEQGI